MSETTVNVEDSIKIALDAADIATNAASEFDKIRNENQVLKGQVMKLYRSVTIVLFSAVAGIAISIAGAATIYFKTLSGMETANNTSLEALVIFAENVDKLAAAVGAVDDMTAELGTISSLASSTDQALAELGAKFDQAQLDLDARLKGEEEQVVNSISQFSRSVIDEVNTGMVERATVTDQKLQEISEALVAMTGGTSDAGSSMAAAGMKPSQVDEIIASLQKILLSQAEINTKLSAMSQPKKSGGAAKSSPKKKPQTGSTAEAAGDDMIKFP